MNPPAPREEPTVQTVPDTITEPQVKKIMALFGEVKTLRGLKEIPRQDRLRAYSQWAGRDIVSTDALTKDEAAHVIDRLDSWIADLVAAGYMSDGELVQGELIDEDES